MQFVKEWFDLPTAQISALVAAETLTPFDPSDLYEVATELKVHDPERRLSEFRRLSDPLLLDACEALVREMSDADEVNTFILLRNDATHIRYGVGGFFSQHRDYLATTSNVLEEYTLLVCVTPPGVPTEGGQTRVAANPRFRLESAATVTRGGALLFRKDLEHEALPVTAGEKHVLSLNLWASRKAEPAVLLLTFPPAPEAADPLPPAVGSGAAPLRDLAAGRSYALSVSQLRRHPDCILNTVAELLSADAATAGIDEETGIEETGVGRGKTTILRHQITECSFEDFAVVFRVITGQYVSPAQAVSGARVLDFFGISPESVLVSAVNTENAAAALEAAKDAASAGTGASPVLSAEVAARAVAGLQEEYSSDAVNAAGAAVSTALASMGLGGRCCDLCGRGPGQREGPQAPGLAQEDEQGAAKRMRVPAAGAGATDAVCAALVVCCSQRSYCGEACRLLDAPAHAPLCPAAAALRPAVPSSPVSSADEDSESIDEYSGCDDFEFDFNACIASHVRAVAVLDGEKYSEAMAALSDLADNDGELIEIALRQAAGIRLRRIAQQRELDAARRADELLRLGLRPASFSADDAIICCSSEERTRVVAEAAKALNLPFVRFRVAFVEGSLFYGAGMTGDTPAVWKMMPVWVSLGDYDSVLAARALCTKASASTEPSLFGPDPELKDDDGSGGEDGGGSGVPRRYVVDSDDEDNWDYDRAMLHYPLLQHACGGVSDSAEEAAATAAAATAAAQQQFGADALLRFVTAYDEYQGAGGDVPWGVRLPGARDAPEERNAALPPGALFHLDSGGQACFTEAEAERAAAHLYKMDFVRAVQAQVNNLSFQLPQVHGEVEGAFCNESIYGTCNLVEVTGVVRLLGGSNMPV